MVNTRKPILLLSICTALVTLIFYVNVIISRAAAGARQDVRATVADVIREYNTAASKQLRKLEGEFNRRLPSGISPIVYLDYDIVATWFGMREGPATVERAIGDYLTVKTGRSYDAPTLSRLARAMNSLDAEGIVLQKERAAGCIVVPVYPGISFSSFYAAGFRVASADLLAGKTVMIGMSTREFADFVNAHETWHCLDIRYIRDTGDGLAGAVKQNRSEMFADIGGVMEGIRDGADLTLIDRTATLHAAWAFLTGPAHARTPEESDTHFFSIVYVTQDGLHEVKTRIKKMGVESFRQLDREKMRALDYEITDAHCLTYEQAQGLQTYYATGHASAAAMPLVARLKAIGAAAVRDATPAELTDRQQAAKEASNDGGLTQKSILEKLHLRAGELGDATSFANQLRARQEMTDSLRDKLMRDPSSERVTEAQLKLLLYTDPHLLPRNGGIQH